MPSLLDRLSCPLERASVADLTRAGVPVDHALRIANCAAQDSLQPFLTLADDGWPPSLRQTPDGPAVLFYQGDLGLLSAPGVALVGTRRATELGRRMARRVAAAIVAAGGVVVSGLANGIDTEAHLAAPGRTIAVLGQGLSVPLYGLQGRTMQNILDEGGLVLSEFLPDMHPTKWTFPQRNRIIAALGRVTVVIEAGLRSGALITARRALELGRDVLAVPGSPLMDSSLGCLDLISQGARIVRRETDVLDAAGLTGAEASPTGPAALLALLSGGPSFDQILERAGLPLMELQRALAALELSGLVRRLPGDRYLGMSEP